MNEQYERIIAQLEMCITDLDELSNKANDYHICSRYATAANKVQDIIEFLKQ